MCIRDSAGAAPVGNARPADAIFHAHVDHVATAGVVEMMAGVGEIALPGFLEPLGDLLRFGVAVDPVLQHVIDAVLGAVGCHRVFGVPDADAFADAADGEIARDALVEGDARCV